MTNPIILRVGSVVVEAELFDTPCAQEIARSLPIEATLQEWGDEIYFSVPVTLPPDETATTQVDVGDIGYWPPGSALAVFYGPTPMSTGERPVPASEVNLVGRITGEPKVLGKAKGARSIRVDRA